MYAEHRLIESHQAATSVPWPWAIGMPVDSNAEEPEALQLPPPQPLPAIGRGPLHPRPRADHGRRRAMRSSGWRGHSHRQHSSNESHGAGQRQADDHEQHAGDEEYGPPADPDCPCEVREPRSTEWIGWADG